MRICVLLRSPIFCPRSITYHRVRDINWYFCYIYYLQLKFGHISISIWIQDVASKRISAFVLLLAQSNRCPWRSVVNITSTINIINESSIIMAEYTKVRVGKLVLKGEKTGLVNILKLCSILHNV